MRKHALVAVLLGLAVGLWADSAMAQYKNLSLGFDVGYWAITKPSVTDSSTATGYKPQNNWPIRTPAGIRFGGEANFKLDADHWWLTSKVNLGFLLHQPAGSGLDQAFDEAAQDALGTLLGLEFGTGIRYVILTDRIRPYIQVMGSYLRLFPTGSTSATCVTALCGTASNSTNFLPHPNVFVLHAQPGLEWVFTRDVAINVFVDLQKWFIFNASDNLALVAGLGLAFFG